MALHHLSRCDNLVKKVLVFRAHPLSKMLPHEYTRSSNLWCTFARMGMHGMPIDGPARDMLYSTLPVASLL